MLADPDHPAMALILEIERHDAVYRPFSNDLGLSVVNLYFQTHPVSFVPSLLPAPIDQPFGTDQAQSIGNFSVNMLPTVAM
ncbi:hypothetical protein HMH01_16825 [Halovulum dunhuangense]|uniref:Uncharacterized protein n=1 Tax=Halovulum dunhuangense TaxID=1505036 RepID=A0A849L769_9RHOB|nr:hypothetical protein [Halovulum dunhuangense]NNU82103.1 hypothetical protein [Halovulum dunhuangense]